MQSEHIYVSLFNSLLAPDGATGRRVADPYSFRRQGRILSSQKNRYSFINPPSFSHENATSFSKEAREAAKNKLQRFIQLLLKGAVERSETEDLQMLTHSGVQRMPLRFLCKFYYYAGRLGSSRRFYFFG